MSPSSFGDSAYWDERYAKRTEDFDWLLPATCMDDAIVRGLENSSRPNPRIIHLGCGTSTLSYHLRDFVKNPEQIHNVDFSAQAIKLCKEKERELFLLGTPGEDAEDCGSMEWSVLDLLASDQIAELAARGDRNPPYDVVVDKSTCDSVCCADDRPIPDSSLIRAAADILPPDLETDSVPVTTSIHPLDLLGINLAYLTPPGSHWIALSYSKDRFSDWYSTRRPPPQWIRSSENCLPHPSRLWEMKSWEAIPIEQKDGKAGEGIHQPEINHYIYVLVRTHVPLAGSRK
ncbi:hypothetical protein VUR80DRAFT_2262 [Thermomyces stellatus]